MGSRIEIRAFRSSDMGRILEIERAAFPKEAYTRAIFRELHKDCPELFLVAERSGRIVGYMVTCPNRRKAELVSIAIDPARQKRGAGTALMAHTLAALETRGVQIFELMVRPANKVAARFYRRFGFVRAGAVARYYEDGGDGVRMTREFAKKKALRGAT